MAKKKTTKAELRVYISQETNRLIRAISGLKSDRDWSLSDITEDALQYWLQRPDNQELIERHNLDKIQ